MKRFLAAALVLGGIFVAAVRAGGPGTAWDLNDPPCLSTVYINLPDAHIKGTWAAGALTVAIPDSINGSIYGGTFVVPIYVTQLASPTVLHIGFGSFWSYRITLEYDDTLFDFVTTAVDSMIKNTISDLYNVEPSTLTDPVVILDATSAGPITCVPETGTWPQHVYKTITATVYWTNADRDTYVGQTTEPGNGGPGTDPYLTPPHPLIRFVFNAPHYNEMGWSGWETSANFTVYCNNNFPAAGETSSWFYGAEGDTLSATANPCAVSNAKGNLDITDSGCWAFDLEGDFTAPRDSVCADSTVGRTCIPCLVCDDWDPLFD